MRATLSGVEAIPNRDERPALRGPMRWLLLGLGGVFTFLAALGAFLPVLPTTPFLLLAAACFVRSSPSFHRRLLENRVFGPYLAQWNHDHTVPLEAKRKAYGLVVVSFTVSVGFVDALWLRILLTLLGVALLVFLRSLRVTEEPFERTRETSS
jgi:uncharacterized membrane protein YbaN (DUF454 family)